MIYLVAFKQLNTGVLAFAKHLHEQIPDSVLARVSGTHRSFKGFTTYLPGEIPADAPCILLDTPKLGEAYRTVEFLEGHRNAVLVVHDPRSLREDKADVVPHVRGVVVIRKGNTLLCEGSVFIPHPYTAKFTDEEAYSGESRRWHSISHTRIDFDKRTHTLVDANALLPTSRQIQIFGRENRAYVQWKLRKHDPNWQMGKTEFHCDPRDLCRQAMFDIDLTIIEGDGGGTQYCFLEAADAGAVPIMSASWGLHGHCLHVDSHDDLARLLMSMNERPMQIVAANRAKLREHASVSEQYMELFK